MPLKKLNPAKIVNTMKVKEFANKFLIPPSRKKNTPLKKLNPVKTVNTMKANEIREQISHTAFKEEKYATEKAESSKNSEHHEG